MLSKGRPSPSRTFFFFLPYTIVWTGLGHELFYKFYKFLDIPLDKDTFILRLSPLRYMSFVLRLIMTHPEFPQK